MPQITKKFAPGITDGRGRMPRPWYRSDWFSGAALAAAIFIAYMRVWHAGFIWDDDDHLTANPCVVGPLGFKEIWTTSAAVYYPLVLTTFRLLHAMWGLSPLPYHLFNIAVHAACGVLLWRVLLELRVRGAWLGAALWALHPVMVESVAWITELKNTQSCMFYLLSILCYIKKPAGAARPGWGRHSLAMLFFAMAITSKSSTVMLPVVLALCAWWREGGLSRRGAVALIPFFAVSALAGAWTIWEQKFHSGALGQEWTQTWPQRIVIAGREGWFYLGKLAWPHPLIFIYPRWDADASRPAEYLPLVAGGVVLFALWRGRHGKARPFLFAAVYFIVSLFPVLDIFNVYFFRYSFVSDHFQYLAAMGPLALLAAGIDTAVDSTGAGRPFLKPALCGVLLAAAGFATWSQSAIYSDNDTLYAATIAQNPGCWMARNNLGYDLLHQGRIEESIEQYERALQTMPGLPEAHYNLGLALEQKGRVDEAVAHFQKAVEINPRYADAYYDLGLALQHEGKTDDAVAQYQKALNIAPGMQDALLNLGNIYGQRGRMDDAIAQYQLVLKIKPDYAKAHYNFGYALQKKGEIGKAIAQYQTALEIDPSDATTLNSLAYLLAACPQASLRNSGKAVDLALRAARATKGSNPLVLRTLAAAYAETGRFSEAVETAQRALDLAASQSNAALADELRSQLALYKADRPFRDASLEK